MHLSQAPLGLLHIYVSPSISALGALTSLLLSDNGIPDLPIAPLATLNNLEDFDIRKNALTQLPLQLVSIQNCEV
jgi:Leucine-rich repeat (LRR) protein